MNYEYIIDDQIRLHGATEMETFKIVKEYYPNSPDSEVYESIEDYLSRKDNHQSSQDWTELGEWISSAKLQEEKVKMKYFTLEERTKVYTDKKSGLKVEVFTKKYYNWITKATDEQKKTLYNYLVDKSETMKNADDMERYDKCAELLVNSFLYTRYEDYESYIQNLVQSGLEKVRNAFQEFIYLDDPSGKRAKAKISFSDFDCVLFYQFYELYRNNSRLATLLKLNSANIILEPHMRTYLEFKNSEKTTHDVRQVVDKVWDFFHEANKIEPFKKESSRKFYGNEFKLEFLTETREDLYKKRLVREDVYQKMIRLPGCGFTKQ